MAGRPRIASDSALPHPLPGSPGVRPLMLTDGETDLGAGLCFDQGSQPTVGSEGTGIQHFYLSPHPHPSQARGFTQPHRG